MLQIPRHKGKRRLFYAGVILILAIIIAGLVLAVIGIVSVIKNNGGNTKDKEETVKATDPRSVGTTKEGEPYRHFTGKEFKHLYEVYDFAYAVEPATPPIITDNREVDESIRNIAKERGYRLQPVADKEHLDQVLGQYLHPDAKQAFLAMQDAAQKEVDEELVLVSGYRSVEDQREIFKKSIREYSNEEIQNGKRDKEINKILASRSIPGYSKHHTGYSADIGCGNYHLDASIAKSGCFDWLSENNYENAKRFGFIPSYPDGAGKQGPDPEPWEYVYVGEEVLKPMTKM